MSDAGEYFPPYASCAMYWSVPMTLFDFRACFAEYGSTVSKSISFNLGEASLLLETTTKTQPRWSRKG